MQNLMEERYYLKRIFITRVLKKSKLTCPGCRHLAIETYFPTSDSKIYYCRSCLRTVAPLGGTIFSKTKLPLSQWIKITADVLEKGPDIQAKELSIDYNLSMRTSYRILRKINRWQIQNRIVKYARSNPKRKRKYRTEKYILFERILKTLPPLFSNQKTNLSWKN
jgi:transposase-like protein